MSVYYKKIVEFWLKEEKVLRSFKLLYELTRSTFFRKVQPKT